MRNGNKGRNGKMRFLAFFLTLALVLSLVPVTALAGGDAAPSPVSTSYTVRYLLNDPVTVQRIIPDKVVTGQTAGTRVTVEARAIPGYTPVKPAVSVLLSKWENVISFYYTSNKNTRYTVQHLGTNGVTLATQTFTGQTGKFVTAAAKSFAGYTYDAGRKLLASGTVTGDGSLVLKLYYKPNTNITYKVRYLIRSNNPFPQSLIGDKTVINQTMASYVTEVAIEDSDYTVDKPSKSMRLSSSDNIITFYYTRKK